MRNLIMILTGMVLIISAPVKTNAQWNKSFGTTDLNILTEPQLRTEWAKAKKNVETGLVIGAVGGLAAVAGGMFYSSNLIKIETAHYYDINVFSNRAKIGSYVMFGGIGLAVIALPMIIIGSSRKAVIELLLARTSDKVEVRPCFSNELNHPAVGVTVAFSF